MTSMGFCAWKKSDYPAGHLECSGCDDCLTDDVEKALVAIVSGSRNWSNKLELRKTLLRVRPGFVVEGGARGADEMAKEWRLDYGVPGETIKADWKLFGKRAGRVRNIWMLEKYPSAVVIACPLPGGRGTQHMIGQADLRGMRTIVVDPYPFIRASGECICGRCDKKYADHPLSPEPKSFDGHPFLRALCDGTYVKL